MSSIVRLKSAVLSPATVSEYQDSLVLLWPVFLFGVLDSGSKSRLQGGAYGGLVIPDSAVKD